jgi:hypothetical protein
MSVGEKTGRKVTCSAMRNLSEDERSIVALEAINVRGWKAKLIEELNRSAVRKRLPIALAGVASINLVAFTSCQIIYVANGRADLRHPLLWFLDLVAVLAFLRMSLGSDWTGSSTTINLVAKLWTTFLILSFSVVTLNSITGFELSWYKPVWATLSTFLFASLAWVFSPWLFVPAVQMWATGLLMASLIDWAFLIYGVSWWLALMGIAVHMRRIDPVGP